MTELAQRVHGGATTHSIDELTDKVEEVVEDQARRGQVIRLSEADARSQFPDLV